MVSLGNRSRVIIVWTFHPDFNREAITAGKTVKALEEAQEELVSSGVPFIVADELVGRVMGDDPEDIPYSIYKEFGRDF